MNPGDLIKLRLPSYSRKMYGDWRDEYQSYEFLDDDKVVNHGDICLLINTESRSGNTYLKILTSTGFIGWIPKVNNSGRPTMELIQ